MSLYVGYGALERVRNASPREGETRIMELFGIALATLVLFVGFGFMVGVLFGFFGMGGSFLVTPALLVMGYPARVAVGSGMAFVFRTAVIATLKHHDLGQVDYKLGGLMIVGTSVGIEVGRIGVFYLEELGLASGVIGVTYVVLLGAIGVFVTRNALKTTAAVIVQGREPRGRGRRGSIRTRSPTSRRRSSRTASRR